MERYGSYYNYTQDINIGKIVNVHKPVTIQDRKNGWVELEYSDRYQMTSIFEPLFFYQVKNLFAKANR